MGVEPGPTAAVKPGRAAEKELVPIPEPAAEPEQAAGLGAEHPADALEPGPGRGGQQREQDGGQPVQAAVPTANPANPRSADLLRGEGAGPWAGARQQGCLHLVEGGVPVGAHVGGKQPVVVVAPPAGEHEHARELAVEVPVPPSIRGHRALAGGTGHTRERVPFAGVGVAEEGRVG